MGFTYPVQVPYGREIAVQKWILKGLECFGNPGILAIHTLETTKQILNEKGLSPEKKKPQVPTYIFVTVANTEPHGMGMDAACWQLIKRIPLVRKILNTYIQHDEWKQFVDSVDLEPQIEIVEEKNHKLGIKGLKEYWNGFVDVFTESKAKAKAAEPTQAPETIEPETIASETPIELKHEESSVADLVHAATEVLEEKMEQVKDQVVAGLQKLFSSVKTKVSRKKTTYTVPVKLYDMLEVDESTTVQNALYKLRNFLKTVSKAVSEWET